MSVTLIAAPIVRNATVRYTSVVSTRWKFVVLGVVTSFCTRPVGSVS